MNLTFFKNIFYNYTTLIKKIVYTVIFSLIIFYLIKYQLIYPTIVPMVNNGSLNLFADWSAILQANICYEKGFNVYLNNPCDVWNRKHVYGKILLYLPLVKEQIKFYFIYLPILINIFFVYLVISFFMIDKSYKKYFFVFLVISVPSLLAIERFNIDIVIFVLIYLLAKNYNFFLNLFWILLASALKFYPVLTGLIFFCYKSYSKKFYEFLYFLIFAVIFLYLEKNNIHEIYKNQNQFSGLGIYQFSFKGLVHFFNNFQINITFLNYFFYIFTLSPLVLIISGIFKKNLHADFLRKNIFENRLFFISSLILVFCYFLVSNFVYREIFFIGLIPCLLLEDNKEVKFFSFLFYLIIFKFFITSVLIYLNQNNFFEEFNFLIVYLKHLIDFYLISIIFTLSVINLPRIINQNKF